jgi:type I restriction enzyme S subunit
VEAKTLFDNFDLLADATNGIEKLRELILQLAVQGRLVKQDSRDESASVLLKKIHEEKERRIAEKKIRQSESLPPIEEDDKPCELPKGWEWVRLGDIQIFTNGFTFQSKDYITSGIGIVRIGDIQNGMLTKDTMQFVDESFLREVEDKYKVKSGDLVIAMSGATTGKLGFNTTEETFLLNQRVGKIELILINVKYGYSFLSTKIRENLQISSGSAIPNLSTEQINNIIFPLPPLAEQHRIVAKLDEIMALCDELEEQKKKKYETHTALNESVLAHLFEAKDAKEFAMHWQRICDHFELLYDAPESVGKLRSTILQLAVQGKLVKQDPKDEPASVLLEKIRSEKERLIAEKKIKKSDPLPPIKEDEIPFELPEGWLWARFVDLIELKHGHQFRQYDYVPKGIPVIKIGQCKSDGTLDLSNCDYIDQNRKEEFKDFRIYKDDLLMALTGGTLGKVTWVDKDYGFVVQNYRVGKFSPLTDNYDKRFVAIILESNLFQLLVSENVNQNAQPNIGKEKIEMLPIPFLPLEEQRRIIAKVHQLLSYCNEFEAKLTQAESASENFATAVVREMVEG